MAIEITVPELGESVLEATVSRWLKKAGDFVNVGDVVEPGQVIGLVGGTGRVTGAHLHWDLWVNGVQVNPLDWLSQEYP